MQFSVGISQGICFSAGSPFENGRNEKELVDRFVPAVLALFAETLFGETSVFSQGLP